MSWEAAIGAGGSMASSLIGLYGASQQRKWASREAEKNRDFLSRSHQIRVQDLRAAGLNPILSTHAGSMPSPSVPGGAAATAHNIDLAGVFQKSSASKLAQEQLKTQKQITQREKNITERDSAITDYWRSPSGKNFIVPLAAASAAGLNVNSITDAALVPAAMHYNNRNTANSAQGQRTFWDQYKRAFGSGVDAIREGHGTVLKRNR